MDWMFVVQDPRGEDQDPGPPATIAVFCPMTHHRCRLPIFTWVSKDERDRLMVGRAEHDANALFSFLLSHTCGEFMKALRDLLVGQYGAGR